MRLSKHSMRDTTLWRGKQGRLIPLTLATLLLAGCAGKPEKETPEPVAETPVEEQPATAQEVSTTLPPSSYTEVFNSAEQSLARFDWMQASVTLQQLPEQRNQSYYRLRTRNPYPALHWPRPRVLRRFSSLQKE